MRAVGGLVGVITLAAGCSWIFDPAGLPEADLSIPPPPPVDLAVGPDLAREDLQPAPPDCAELPLFPGFFADGGATSPYDCTACGCQLDDFTGGPNFSRKWTQGAPANWSQSVSAGALFQSVASGVNGDAAFIQSNGHFYLAGDFDLLIDIGVSAWVPGTFVTLGTFGPPNDAGAPTPHLQVSLLNATTAAVVYVFIDGQPIEFAALPSSTLELTRAGQRLCGGMLGQTSSCRNGSTAPVFVQAFTVIQNANCIGGCGCCPEQVKFANLRLRSGTIVDHR